MSELEERLAEKEREAKSTVQKRYNQIREQIIKGAEYIESIDETHPKWKVAHEKYDRLCSELIKVRAAL